METSSLVLFLLFLLWANNIILYLIAAAAFVAWSVWTSDMPLRRRIQMATWSPSKEGNIYCKVSLDASKVVEWLKTQKEKGKEVTITHVVGKAAANALAAAPSLNGRILFDKFIPFETVDISFLVVVEGGKQLAKTKVVQADKKSIYDIAADLRVKANKLKKGEDQNFKKSLGALQALPTWAVRCVCHNVGWLSGCLGLDIPSVGVEPFPFGAAIITSVGMMGIDEAYVPFTPFAHVPLMILIGQIKDGIVVVDGKPEVRKKLKVTTTTDHRFLDGAQGGVLIKKLKELFENPSLMEQ